MDQRPSALGQTFSALTAGAAGAATFCGIEGAYILWTGQYIPFTLPLITSLALVVISAIAGVLALFAARTLFSSKQSIWRPTLLLWSFTVFLGLL